MVANGSSRPLSYRFSITTSAVAEGLVKATFLGRFWGAAACKLGERGR